MTDPERDEPTLDPSERDDEPTSESDDEPTIDPFEGVPAQLATALTRRGFESLTPIQLAVLAADTKERDLRIVSRTGSGKTVALGLAIGRAIVERGGAKPKDRGVGKPEVLVVAPTRELAVQVASELAWLYAPLKLKVACVTGGTGLGGDFRALGSAPDVVVGTPGRLVDHLERGSLALDATTELVLDEADAMLDLGFREALERILSSLPAQRRTHLVSATFADEVLSLANRHQKNAYRIESADANSPHADIEHVAYLLRAEDRPSALINLLLASQSLRVLVFVRTRADASDVADGLLRHGFRARAISGELTQRERSSTLEAFRSSEVNVLVATDVAARGLDVQDVASVVHYDIPGSPETFTHRSGRTGRAGRKGTSVLFVPMAARAKVGRLLHVAKVTAQLRPLPGKDEIIKAIDAHLLGAIRSATLEDSEAERFDALAKTLLEEGDALGVVARLLAHSGFAGPCPPCDVAVIDPNPKRDAKRDVRGPSRFEDRGPSRFDDRGPRSDDRGPSRFDDRPMDRPPTNRPPRGGGREYVRFQVSWGGEHGADPRRLLAMSCRRGGISSAEVGAIEVLARSSSIEVAREFADEFGRAVSEPDEREPGIRFRLHRDQPGGGGGGPGGPRRGPPPRDGSRPPAKRPKPRA